MAKPKRKRVAKPVTDIERRVQQRIRRLRHGGGLTLARLSEMAGISQDALARIEGGERVPTIKSLAGLADALGTTVSALLDEKAQPEPEIARISQMLHGRSQAARAAVLQVVSAFLECLDQAG